MEVITSLQNDKVKLVKGLQTRPRTRRKEHKIVLEGIRLVRDAVEQGQRPHFVFYEDNAQDYDLIALMQEKQFTLIPVNAEVMTHVSDTQQPAGILGVFPMPTPPLPRTPTRVLILDRVSDPGNMGTLLRTAAAAGVDVVVLSPGCADPYNPKTLRGGMGAHFRIPVVGAEWPEIVGYCESVNVYVAAGDGDTPYYAPDWTSPSALIIGSEAHGVGTEADALATKRIYIPMAAQTESLNAAMAAGVILFEAARQRQVK